MVRLVLMAAGQAVRMGQDKLLLPWKDSTVLDQNLSKVIRAAQVVNQPESSLFYSSLTALGVGEEAGMIEVVVVARYPIEEYCTLATIESFQEIRGSWRIKDKAYPLAENIRSGLAELSRSVTGVGFLPADQVGTDEGQLVDLIRHFVQLEPDFLVPCAGELTGAPVFFHRRYLPQLLALEGEQGGKSIWQHYPEKWAKHLVTPGFFIDLDTPEDFDRWREEQ